MQPLKILSHNIYFKMMGFNTTDNEYKGERGRLYPYVVKDFDILILQEVFHYVNPRYWDFIQNLEKNNFKYFCKCQEPSFQSQTVGDGGLFIASKYPIVQSEFIPFNTGIQIDSLILKGLLYANIYYNNHNIHYFDIHTQATYAGHHIDIRNVCIIQRIKELLITKKQIKKVIKNNFKKGDSVFLSGDFNLCARDQSIDLEPISKLFCSQKKNFKLPNFQSVYEIMMFVFNYDNNIFEIIDIYYDIKGEHPITYADVYTENGIEKPRDTILTDPDERLRKECLDYIFEVKVKGNKQNYKIKNPKVEPFFLKDQPFGQISDHYGLSFEIHYQN